MSISYDVEKDSLYLRGIDLGMKKEFLNLSGDFLKQDNQLNSLLKH